MGTNGKSRIAIIGAGFAGLYAARTLAKASNVEVTLIDRNNFHTFTPLLYQVATCALDPSAIAYPVRGIFRRQDNVRFLLGEVIRMDTDNKELEIKINGRTRMESYDYMIVAAGSVTNHFGQKSIAEHSFGLKDLDDSLLLRDHILKLFEKAAWAEDLAYRDALLTLVVVGGGPTGLETAGALYELYNHVLKKEYGSGDGMRARVILLEATDRLLAPYPERLRQSAKRQLESLGVEVLMNAMVESVEKDRVILRDGRVVHTHTLVWSAGVKASPLAEMLNVELARAGRVPVERNMLVKGYDNIYAAGDIAYLENAEGMPYPMLIPIAKQQGILAAKNIMAQLQGEPAGEFEYFDRGIMATIGRNHAVAWIFNKVEVTGMFAWLAWLWLHLIVLMGFRNRVSVFVNWVWNYLTYDRSVRLILDRREPVKPSKRDDVDDDSNHKTAA